MMRAVVTADTGSYGGQVKYTARTQTRERAFAAAYKHASCSFPAAVCNTRCSTHRFIYRRRLIGAARR